MCVDGPLRAVDWTFQEIIVDDNPPQPSRITDCAIVDINGDKHLDILNFKYGSDILYIPGLKNPHTPNGKWPFHNIGTAGGTGSSGDLDGDGDIDIDGNGKLDVVVSSEEETDGITWFRNQGENTKGAWAATKIIAPDSGWKGLHTLQLADFDGDDDLDVFTAEMHGRQQQRVAICENADGKGNIWQVHILSKCGTHNAKVADLNGDGAPDIAGKNYDKDKRPRIWLNPKVWLYENLQDQSKK
jgi:hypothetical protein